MATDGIRFDLMDQIPPFALFLPSYLADLEVMKWTFWTKIILTLWLRSLTLCRPQGLPNQREAHCFLALCRPQGLPNQREAHCFRVHSETDSVNWSGRNTTMLEQFCSTTLNKSFALFRVVQKQFYHKSFISLCREHYSNAIKFPDFYQNCWGLRSSLLHICSSLQWRAAKG